ncbi:4-alpha-glucanotransferase [Polyangium mundeleinium]|uniref:4-alpha-glucanotransferase n=1 Tax=Polyangium mundeleinium TaxID=2995306 RepID=A0ABT5EUT4_9BACT|nr:4-alpha-glucanotransferase [Polyangium mundeleinium]MDC0745087.1 4-alpha-glucanotransferase [Polyangium mundeleinium]
MTQAQDKPRREAGILLHPTSLPGPYGMGDLGASARRFLDWLAQAGLGLWQVLPLNPTSNNCPYVCWSAFAGNPLLVDLVRLHELGLLDASDLAHEFTPASLVDFDAVRAFKEPRLDRAAERLLAHPEHPLRKPLAAFREAEASWLEDAALFWLLSRKNGGKAWWDWEPALRDREPAALAKARAEFAKEIEREIAILFFFEHQWNELRAYAHGRGVRIVGDLPIYVDRNSVDVWAHRNLFHLDELGTPQTVSGVPPDYFSETGQLWGNPIYRWDRMAEDDFSWWRARLRRVLAHTDIARIDHFRAFAAYWEIPFGAPDARSGRWVKGPGLAFFQALERHGKMPLVAEDLGMIDEAVHELRRAAGLPGMRVLQFAFGGDADNTHLPHNHEPDNVVYPGTHDNDTTVGFWHAAAPHVRHHVQRYLRVSGQDIAWDFILAAFASTANTAIIPMQDVLSRGSEARMNNPATTRDNWRFLLHGDVFRREMAMRLRELADLYGRLAAPASTGAAR